MPPAFNSSRSLPAVGSDCQKAIRPGPLQIQAPFEIRARFQIRARFRIRAEIRSIGQSTLGGIAPSARLADKLQTTDRPCDAV
jgi:hypothetical protein